MTQFRRLIDPLASVSFVLFLMSATAGAQDTIPSGIIPMNNTGDLPYSTSVGTDIEDVELSTGNLIVSIPFVSVPGPEDVLRFRIAVRREVLGTKISSQRFLLESRAEKLTFRNEAYSIAIEFYTCFVVASL